MARHRNPLIEALRAGRSYTWTVPDGGDLASMRGAIKHGQTLTMSAISDPQYGTRMGRRQFVYSPFAPHLFDGVVLHSWPAPLLWSSVRVLSGGAPGVQ